MYVGRANNKAQNRAMVLIVQGIGLLLGGEVAGFLLLGLVEQAAVLVGEQDVAERVLQENGGSAHGPGWSICGTGRERYSPRFAHNAIGPCRLYGALSGTGWS